MQRISAVLSALALASGLTVPVQATPPTDEEVITVTGTRMNEEEARTRSRAHVGAVLGTPVSGQNARWSAPLCIAIVGVQPTMAGPVLDRMEAVVRTAGAELGKQGCRPNVVVHFTANAEADFAAIERKRPDLLEQTFAEDREKLRKPDLPVRWFYGRKLEGVGGRQLDVDPSGGTLAGMPILREGGASRITTPVQVNITSVTVLVDVPRVAGVPLNALADYIAFAMLSRTRMDVPPASGSIMALFQASEDARPEGLTALDLAFLKALYTVPINFVSNVHRGSVMEAMVKDLSTPTP